MRHILLAVIPMTPTPFPETTGIATQLDTSQFMNMWDAAPEVVGFWGQFREYTPTLQWVLVALLIVALIFALMFLFRWAFGGTSEEV